jgi:hypothetical protein
VRGNRGGGRREGVERDGGREGDYYCGHQSEQSEVELAYLGEQIGMSVVLSHPQGASQHPLPQGHEGELL